jgi:hypothetical protein
MERRRLPFLGHETDMPTALLNVCFQGQSGKHVLALSFSGFDPKRTSGLSLHVHEFEVFRPQGVR